jgi:hypothetical protein
MQSSQRVSASQDRMALLGVESLSRCKFQRLYVPIMVANGASGIAGIACSIANMASNHFISELNGISLAASVVLASVSFGHIYITRKGERNYLTELSNIYKQLEGMHKQLQHIGVCEKEKKPFDIDSVAVDIEAFDPTLLRKETLDLCHKLAKAVDGVHRRICQITIGYSNALSEMNDSAKAEVEQWRESVGKIKTLVETAKLDYMGALSGKRDLFDIPQRLEEMLYIIDSSGIL